MRQTMQEDLRVVLYSHDSLGLGHSRRNLAIAHAMAAAVPELTGRTVTGLLVTGESHATRFESPDGWDWVVLPGVGKGLEGYVPRHLAVSQQQLTGLRSHIMNAVLQQFRPHLMIVDRHAFGVDGELKQALSELRTSNPDCRVVLGLREVLDSPSAVKREWRNLGVSNVRRCFDELWVYGDPRIHDPLLTGEIPQQLAPMVRFTGYLAAGRHASRPTSGVKRPYLLTMAGGGSDGLDVVLTAARTTVPAGYEHLIIAGPQMPKAHRAQVERAAVNGTRVLGSVRDALAEIKDASAIVSMGGYNSVCEIMSTNTPALLIPRVTSRREQIIRAESLARRHLVDVCHPEEFTSAAMAAWLETALGTHVVRSEIDLDGLSAVGRLAADLMGVVSTPANSRRDWESNEAV
ncbi:glycosyltransferase family protein [Arthrobacter pigmenti]